jgi:hypothetical protein
MLQTPDTHAQNHEADELPGGGLWINLEMLLAFCQLLLFAAECC